mmetsp:Transcript_5128/g.15353  ORF Transcript_5128/g.15353 Transcript_5128/m.15353 type:complete len:272 (-) Transcript_5128:688-1503(-)
MMNNHLPFNAMPDKQLIRKLDPTLANRIECIAGGGWRQVAQSAGWNVQKAQTRGQYSKNAFPAGYFDNSENLRREIERFNSEVLSDEVHRLNLMPTSKDLVKRPMLLHVVRERGGPDAVAPLIGMCAPSDWKYFQEFKYLVKSLRDCVQEIGKPGHMPSFKQLADSDNRKLASLISRHGGVNALGARLDLKVKSARRENLCWGPFCINFAIDVLEASEQSRCIYDGMIQMPAGGELEKLGVKDAPELIDRFGGGDAVARRLGLAPSRLRRA